MKFGLFEDIPHATLLIVILALGYSLKLPPLVCIAPANESC